MEQAQDTSAHFPAEDKKLVETTGARHDIIVNDSDAMVANFWRCMKKMPQAAKS